MGGRESFPTSDTGKIGREKKRKKSDVRLHGGFPRKPKTERTTRDLRKLRGVDKVSMSC